MYRVSVPDQTVKDHLEPDSGNPADLAFSVRATEPDITGRSTATVVLERENTGEEPIEVGTNPESGPHPQYSSTVGDEGPLGVVLAPAEFYDLESAAPACWSPDVDGLTVLAHGGTMGLDPGESVALEYEVWAEPTEERHCLEPGTYDFEELLVTWTLQVATT